MRDPETAKIEEPAEIGSGPELTDPGKPSDRPGASNRSAGLGCITLVAVFFVAVSAFGLSYQTRPAYKIDLGERLDRPFVANFNDREPGEADRGKDWDGVSWRWSRAESYLEFPGIGSQPL